MLPAIMVLMVVLLQPACLLYTRSVMRSAAASTARAVMSEPASGTSNEVYIAHALRRLAAVPQLDIFHVGGSGGWDISVGRLEGKASCSISTHVRPLPLMGAAVAALGGGDTVLEVHVEQASRPSWLGGDYHGWTSMWGA